MVYGAIDPKAGAAVSLYRIAEDTRLNHRFDVDQGASRRAGRGTIAGLLSLTSRPALAERSVAACAPVASRLKSAHEARRACGEVAESG